MNKASFAYAHIRHSDGFCEGVLQTSKADYSINNSSVYSMPVNPAYAEQYVGKYYISGVWYERVWNELDENGEPVIESGYVDTVWEPTV